MHVQTAYLIPVASQILRENLETIQLPHVATLIGSC